MVAKTLEDSMNSIFKFQAIWESQKMGCKWGEMLKSNQRWKNKHMKA
jgi:hypothetical protein